MRRLFPDQSTLDDEGLRDAYALDRTRPSVRVNFVSSLDGAVEVSGYSRGLSSPTDHQLFGMLRAHSDAVMVGAGTLRHEGYGPLTIGEKGQAWRRANGLAEQPTMVIVSSSLEVDPTSAVFTDAPVRPVVLTHAGAPPERRAALEPVADVITCGDSVVDLSQGLTELQGCGLDQILCEGGPFLFGALLAADLVDELCLSISPLLAGSGASRIIADGRRALPAAMRLVHLIHADEDMLLSRYART
jgi:riboflavin-specific deaminase-like protein